DISDMKKIEKRNNKNLIAIENSNINMLITDKFGKIEFVNKAFLDFYGYNYTDIIGKGLDFLFLGSKDIFNEIKTNIENSQNWQKRLVATKKNGEKSFINLKITSLRDNDAFSEEILFIQEDITELVNMQENLIKAIEKSEQANKAKSFFLANMSHEIRTPLNGILGIAELVKDSELNEKQSKYINNIIESGKHLFNIVNNILDFSKIEKGELNLNNSSFNLKKIIKKVIDNFELILKNKNISLLYTIDENIPEEIIGDDTRIRQILINLINNSVKFTQEGCISVEANLKEIFLDNIIINFIVSDTGIGISEDKIEVIFEDFKQLDENPDKNYEGTGLGLSIVKKIVNAMGGELSVKSSPGIGSSFSFVVFFKKNEEILLKVENKENVDISGLKILIAEDNEINQVFMKDILKSMGVNVEIAGNGKIALEKIKEFNFDCILMDINMPVMSGLDALIEIRKSELGTDKHIPVIAITADAIVEDMEKFKIAGFDKIVTKPFKPVVLKKNIYNLISNTSKNDDFVGNIEVKDQAECKLIAKDKFYFKLIDIDKAVEYFCDAPVQIIIDTIDIFIKSHTERFNALKKSVMDMNVEEVRKIIHNIAGIVSFFHCNFIDQLFNELREFCKQGKKDKMLEKYIELENIIPDFITDLEQLSDYFKNQNKN
ncbi:MAG: ATP-binding protein, partial [Candidatus Muirbacterium halophilum]|nr:ATP-binding protein [Candidatus Muirbacterium halophilum]